MFWFSTRAGVVPRAASPLSIAVNRFFKISAPSAGLQKWNLVS
jgi:hypothetical protein